MKRALSAIVVFLLLFPPVGVRAAQRPVDILRSIQPIQGFIGTGEFKEDGDQIVALGNICTAFSINEQEKYWMTAEHCLEDGADKTFFQGEPVHILYSNKTSQLAVIKGKYGAPALHMQHGAAEYGESIIDAGYPQGHEAAFMTFGHVANPSADMSKYGLKGLWTVTDIAGSGGMSGSPIVNEDLEVVSVHMWGWGGGTWGPVGGGTRWEDIKLEIGPYFTDGR